MRIRVRLFARSRDLAGADSVELELSDHATVADLRRQMARAVPKLAGLLGRSAFAVNDEFADDTQTLKVGSEVALLPPVSGG